MIRPLPPIIILLLAAAPLMRSVPTYGQAAQEPDVFPSNQATMSPRAAPAPIAPPPLVLRSEYPEAYTVTPGDTQWSIAGKFLKKPWQWREIRGKAPDATPQKIFPGDVLTLRRDGSGAPLLDVQHPEGAPPLLKLSPTVRMETLTQAISPVSRDAVESFLIRALVLSSADWKTAPYVVGDDDEQITYTERDRIYARGAEFDKPHYQIFRPGNALIEPGSGRSLGTMGIYMGEAALERDADPAAFKLTKTIGPVRTGDRLFEFDAEKELYNFEPHPVPPDTDGFIIAQLNPDVTQITQNSSVLINLGAQEGLHPGHVLAIYNKDRTIQDPVAGTPVKLPGERAGLLMVYKVHDLVSYALVMDMDRAIRLQDRVTTP